MNCKQCNQPIEDKRPDSIYCNHNCQQKYYKRKQLLLSRIKKTEDEIELLRSILEDKRKAIFSSGEKQKTLEEQFKAVQAEQQKYKQTNEKYFKIIALTMPEFKQMIFQSILKNEDKNYNDAFIVRSVPEEHERLVDEYYKKCSNVQAYAEHQYNELTKQVEQLNLEIAMQGLIKLGLWEEFEKNRKELAELEPKLKELKEIDPERLPAQPVVISLNGKPKYRPQVRSYTGSEILKMEFDTLELEGELGRFMGRLQREKCAIALTGDSGAGKSTFSYQLAKAFLKKSLNVAYFALETGFTETVKEQIERYKISQYKFEAFSEGTLDDVRLAAPHFDCIIIDSYSKISTKPEDFESLRQDFPNTFFIIIFQKTTDGKIRGGSSILFNSTATIDIRLTKGGHRIAFMQKSRYETENFVYSIGRDRLLKDDKTPISWAEIEENWPEPGR